MHYLLKSSMFESSVNPEGSKTEFTDGESKSGFESSVNPEGSKTYNPIDGAICLFESSVNPEGSKTTGKSFHARACLRVV